MSTSDSELIGRFAHERDEGAFGELVRRHIDLVHSAALRQCDGRAAPAEDIAQTVFTQLATKALSLTNHPSLAGWLYSATRLAALEHRRSEARRLEREGTFHRMNPTHDTPPPEPDWTQIQPVLDEAMHSLPGNDREAVLLRYFEKRPLAEVGARLGVSENAARMRVDRALDRLRSDLSRRGITSTALALGAALTHHAVAAAPGGLAERIGAHALASAAATTAAGTGGFLAGLWLWLTSSTGKLALGTALIATTVGIAVVRPALTARITAETRGASNQAVGAPGGAGGFMPPQPGAPATTETETAPEEPATAADFLINLQFVAADSGQAVPGVVVGYRGWKGDAFTRRKFVGRRDGGVEVRVVEGTTRLELNTEAEGFANRRLVWQPPNGESIPLALTVRLERAVAIGGRVVDSDGQPVAGARVGWGTESAAAEGSKEPTHWFQYLETQTDAEGRWSIARIAAEVLPHLNGSAEHPGHQPSQRVSTDREPEALAQLTAGTHVFRLAPAATVRGLVVNVDGEPIPEAKILVGRRGFVGSRTSAAAFDGVFTVPGCALGNSSITAEASGYAAKTVPIVVAAEMEPVRIELTRAASLRLRVIDAAGDPVPQATVWLNTFARVPAPADDFSQLPVQAEFNGRTDAEGRVEWRESPAGTHPFDVAAAGFMRTNHVMIPADDKEHDITLARSLIVQGRVTDAATGKPLPKFRIVFGWPQSAEPGPAGSTPAQFSTIDRFQPEFTGGQYRHELAEEVLGGTPDRRCVVRFDAEGYTSATSRPIGYNEGTVTLDVALEPARIVSLKVVEPGGRPAARARLGIPGPGSMLVLRAGELSTEAGAAPGVVFESDASGELRMDSSRVTGLVLVAHPSGFAMAPLGTFQPGGNVRLAPWSRVEGRFPRPGVRFVRIALPQVKPSTLAVDIGAATDAQGAFVLGQVPFGQVRVEQNVVSTLVAGSSSSSSGPFVDLELAPGETRRIELASGARIVGRVTFPPNAKRPRQAIWLAGYHTTIPELASVTGAVDPDAYRRWLSIPENAARAARMLRRPVAIAPDGLMSADGVPPGDYTLELALTPVSSTPDAPPQPGSDFGATLRFTVPAEPADAELDLGAIHLQPR